MSAAVDEDALVGPGVPGLTFTASLCLPLGRAAPYEEITGQVWGSARRAE